MKLIVKGKIREPADKVLDEEIVARGGWSENDKTYD